MCSCVECIKGKIGKFNCGNIKIVVESYCMRIFVFIKTKFKGKIMMTCFQVSHKTRSREGMLQIIRPNRVSYMNSLTE